MATKVIGIRKDGEAEVYVPLEQNKDSQMESIHNQFPEAVIRQESSNFLSVAFKTLRFASKASRILEAPERNFVIR